jgi:hypothetical protein
MRGALRAHVPPRREEQERSLSQLLALPHKVPMYLSAKVYGGMERKPRPSQKPIRGKEGGSVLATTFIMARMKLNLLRYRTFALRLANSAVEHAVSSGSNSAPSKFDPPGLPPSSRTEVPTEGKPHSDQRST